MYVIKLTSNNGEILYYSRCYTFNKNINNIKQFDTKEEAKQITTFVNSIGIFEGNAEVIPYDSIIGTYISTDRTKGIISRTIRFFNKLIM